jgi:hypothetical protein
MIAAPNDKRYVGLYHWCAYWRHWDYVIDVTRDEWVVEEVTDGPNDAPVRRHRTQMDATKFADAPFFQVRK